MKKKSADFKSSLNTRGFNSISTEVNGFKLEITHTTTVYWNSGKGKRKLDSIHHKKTGLLSVCLPDDTTVELYNTPEGIKVKK